MIHLLPWVTIFGSLVMRSANNFHSWLRHSWKLLANRLTRDPKIVIHSNSCIFLHVFACFFSCFSWVRSLAEVLPSNLLHCAQQHVIFYWDISRVYSIWKILKWVVRFSTTGHMVGWVGSGGHRTILRIRNSHHKEDKTVLWPLIFITL